MFLFFPPTVLIIVKVIGASRFFRISVVFWRSFFLLEYVPGLLRATSELLISSTKNVSDGTPDIPKLL